MSASATISEAFASWGLGLGIDSIPEPAQRAAARHLMDGFGCALAAHQAHAAPYATALVDGMDEATVIGAGSRASVPRAALANGILVHALDFDDTHADSLVHATAAVLPTALAVGEKVGATGEQMLIAAVAGYELVARIGAAVTHGFHAQGFHATSVCGVFASTLVAARLLGLDEARTVNALGIAGSTAAGSLEFLETGSATKQLHPGFSAMNGIVAARLAAAGAEGPSTIFEGRYGLFRAYLDANVDAASVTRDLGEVWETERITIKPYAACQLSHASLDAMRAIGELDPATVATVTFAVPPQVASIVCDKPNPRTSYEAKFSLEHCAAALLDDGELTIASFDEDSIQRHARRAATIHWRECVFEGAPADAPGICEVTLTDGTLLKGEVSKSRGGPDAPLSDDEVLAKFLRNAGTRPQADAWLNLAALADLSQLFGANS